MRLLKNQKKIMLIVTESCNLRCVYCYEQEKRAGTMDFGTAKGILDRAYADMEGYESMVIELHGGEPFLNFPLIREIDAYVMEHYGAYPVLFRMITNGTLVHGEIQEWLRERADRYEVMLSMDGMKETHDRNRPYPGGRGSFEKIDLDFFKDTWENCPVSMTVNEKSLPDLAGNTIWMEEQGFDCLSAFEWATDWELEKNYPVLDGQLDLLVDYYIRNPGRKPCLLLRYNFRTFLRGFDGSYRYCVEIGDPIECYDAKGNFAPCHGFTEFTMGSGEQAEKFRGRTIRDFVFTEENRCYGCRLKRMCRICFAANQMQYGDMQRQNESICIFNQLCILKGIEILRGRLAGKRDVPEEERQELAAAGKVEEYIRQRGELP